MKQGGTDRRSTASIKFLLKPPHSKMYIKDLGSLILSTKLLRDIMARSLLMDRLEVEKLLPWKVMTSRWITQHNQILVPNNVLWKPLT